MTMTTYKPRFSYYSAPFFQGSQAWKLRCQSGPGVGSKPNLL